MNRKAGFDPRSLMEKTIEVMRQSVDEPRSDGKACPKVGAVLLKPDGTLETACRGELRDGDHAEFTLLERKNRGNRLDGSMLFSTLEPCAPGARSAPKLGCAERIALARIKEVWVGIEDPDPTVARKGIKHLQDHGVTVCMFDPDLQDAIQEANKEFLAQAIARATAADEVPAEITLSPLEGTLAHAAIDDLSRDALDMYRASAQTTHKVGSSAFNRGLARLGLMKTDGSRFTPTGFGFILFGSEPRTALPQAGLLGTIHHPDGTQEVRTFDGPQVRVPEEALGWLHDKLPAPIDRAEARRRDANAPFFELVREGIVNALVHRDYGIAGAKCQLVITTDTITVLSPGMPVAPITLEQMQAFSAPILSRNPVLHYVFAQLKLAEERGLGLRSLKVRAQQLGLPLPRYTWNDPYLALTLYRSPEAAALELAARGSGSVSLEDRSGLEFLATRGSVTRKEYAEAMGFDVRKAQRQLKRLVDAGIVITQGAGPTTRYVIRDL